MHSFILLLSLLATLALAAPHAIHHQFLHYNRDLSPSIAGRSISDIGLCGGDSGFVCAEGSCCSQWGYCGTSSDYCGVGCQSGSCDAAASSGASSVNSTSSSSPAATFAPSPTKLFNAPLFSSEVESSSMSEASPAVSVAQLTTMVTLVSSSVPTSTSVATASTSVYVAPSPTIEAPSSTTTSTVASNSPSSSPSTSGSGQGLGDVYTKYIGDGSTSQGWPSLADWVDFDTLWNTNSPQFGCGATPGVAPNSAEETADIKAAIQSIAASTGVDERFILAIITQESNGCVRSKTTNFGVNNPGLMQSDQGLGSCNPIGGPIQDPCPQSEIQQMIEDGTSGTLPRVNEGYGLVQYLGFATSKHQATSQSQYYVAARLYNSGMDSITGVQYDLTSYGATSCYASDVANRLTGWVHAPHGCVDL